MHWLRATTEGIALESKQNAVRSKMDEGSHLQEHWLGVTYFGHLFNRM